MYTLTPIDHRVHAAAAVHGHRVAPDFRSGQRDGWACEACGKRVWLAEGAIVGPATVEDCPPEVGTHDARLPQRGQVLPAPDVALNSAALRRFGIRMESMGDTAASDLDGAIVVLPWDAAMESFLAGIGAGAMMFQRFVCDHCGAIQSMPVPNRAYTFGRCEECAGLTDLQVRGFGAYGLAPQPGADRAAFEALVKTIAAGMHEAPDNFVRRHRGEQVKTTPHRAPCRNCGEPFHAGKPCGIRARRAARKSRA